MYNGQPINQASFSLFTSTEERTEGNSRAYKNFSTLYSLFPFIVNHDGICNVNASIRHVTTTIIWFD